MGDVIAFFVFIGFIVAGILFSTTGGYIKENNLRKGENGLLLLFGIMLPLIVYYFAKENRRFWMSLFPWRSSLFTYMQF